MACGLGGLCEKAALSIASSILSPGPYRIRNNMAPNGYELLVVRTETLGKTAAIPARGPGVETNHLKSHANPGSNDRQETRASPANQHSEHNHHTMHHVWAERRLHAHTRTAHPDGCMQVHLLHQWGTSTARGHIVCQQSNYCSVNSLLHFEQLAPYLLS